jgi:hypothetical protein
MASRRDPSSAQRKPRASRQKEQGTLRSLVCSASCPISPSTGKAPQGIKKERPRQTRRSARILRLQMNGEERKLERRHSYLSAKEVYTYSFWYSGKQLAQDIFRVAGTFENSICQGVTMALQYNIRSSHRRFNRTEPSHQLPCDAF